MLNNLTYKKKNQLLLVGAILFLFIAYYLAFGRTISLYRECSTMEDQLLSLSDAPNQSAILQAKLTQLDQTLGGRQLADTNTQQALLNVVSNYCKSNDALLREFPKAVSKQENEYIVETNVFTVEGNFMKLLQLVYLLEQKERIGKLASVLFQSKQDARTKVLALTATIYVQNVKKIQNAE
jgi:hypothetical protein